MAPKNAQSTPGILAIFSYLDDFSDAVTKTKDRPDFKGHEVITHTSYHELIDLAEKRFGPSQVRWFTLTGALSGLFTGFLMTLWMDYDWPIVVGGKTAGWPSVIAYVVFGFELMVLFGALATILGMLVMGRLPNPYAKIYDTRLLDDKFAIFVPGANLGGEQAKLLKDWGATEILPSP